jgi:hypothetical protein
MNSPINLLLSKEETEVLVNIFYDFKFYRMHLEEFGWADENVMESLLTKLNLVFDQVPDTFIPPSFPFWKGHPNYVEHK